MATDDQQILVTGQASAPATWRVPGNGQVTPRTVFAHYNGSAAAVPFQAALKVVSDGGKTVGIYPVSATIAAGGSADISWFPGVGASGVGGTAEVVGARIEATVAQTIPDSTATDLVYDSVAFDTAGMANLAADSRILTVTVSGLYLLTCSTIWTYNGAGGRLNNVTHNAYYAPAASSVAGDSRPAVWASPIGGIAGAPRTTNTAVTTVDALAGDFFASGCGQYSGGNLNCNGVQNGNVNNYLSAILLGRT